MTLFSAALSSPNILPYNSFNLGFQFTSPSPITGQYIVYMYIGAAGVVEGSIAHNLPAYNSTGVYCYYDTSNVWIACQNVGAFINTNYRYFISGKAYFSSTTTSPLTNFGQVTITPVAYSSSGTAIAGTVLYNTLAGVSTTVNPSQ